MCAKSKKEILLSPYIDYMSSPSDDSSAAKLKNAASLLVKGGTLTGEPCEKCGGVLIRFKEKTTCISCGAETGAVASSDQVTAVPKKPALASSELGSCVQLLEKKIIRLTSDLAGEEDILLEKQKAELLETYLGILERLRKLTS